MVEMHAVWLVLSKEDVGAGAKGMRLVSYVASNVSWFFMNAFTNSKSFNKNSMLPKYKSRYTYAHNNKLL